MRVNKKFLLRSVMKYINIVTDECANCDDIDKLNELLIKYLIDGCFDGIISEDEYVGYLRIVEYVTELAKINLRWIENGID